MGLRRRTQVQPRGIEILISASKDRHAVEALRAGRHVPSWRLRRLIKNSPKMLRCPSGWKKIPVQGFPGVYVCVPPGGGAQTHGEFDLAEQYQRVGGDGKIAVRGGATRTRVRRAKQTRGKYPVKGIFTGEVIL